MKFVKSIIAFATAATMLACSFAFVSASETATVDFSTVSSETLSNNTTFTTYDITGSVCGDTAKSYVFEFNPADGNIPLAYSGTAGGVTTIKNHMEYAKEEGYEVVGAINGSFFQGATSTLTGMLIFDGRIICSDSGAMEPLACFDAEGKMTHVENPSVKYSVFINGTENTDALVSINKKYDYIAGKGTTSTGIGNFFYYDRHVKNCYSPIADESVSGYEILCNKVGNTELSVGETLKGEVVSVNETTFGKTVPENDGQFVLFVTSDSAYAATVKDLEAGDSVAISAEGAPALETAYSGINSAFWLVYDGVDKTNTSSTIIHSVTLQRAWTAFGVKEDGSFVYFVNEEYGLTLKDVAAAMIDLGCKYVIRIDGGGSSAVYNEKDGVVYLAERPEEGGRMVCDTLLIVKKSSLTDEELTDELESVLATVKTIKNPNTAISAAIEEAEKILASEYPAEGMVKRALSNLNLKSILESMVEEGKAQNASHYSEEDFALLESAIASAEAVLSADESSNEEFNTAIEAITNAIALSKYKNLSVGASYEVTNGVNYDYWADATLLHDDGIRLTDGAAGTRGVMTANYSAWKGNGKPVTVVVDLGEEAQSNIYSIYTGGGYWGISHCNGLKVEGSNDNENFELIGETAEIIEIGDGDTIESTVSKIKALTIRNETSESYRYIRFTMNVNGSFLWVDEVEVAYDGAPAASEESQESSEAETESQETEESKEESSVATQASDGGDESQNNDDGGNTGIIIGIVAAVVVIAAVVIVIIKKRK